MTIRGGARSLNARLARLEQSVPEPQGPIVWQVLFADGTPVWPGPDDGLRVEGDDIVYLIASWDEALFGGQPGSAHPSERPEGQC